MFLFLFFVVFFGGGYNTTNISAGVTVFVTAVASVCVGGGGEGCVLVSVCVFMCLRAWVHVSLHVCMRVHVCV